MPKRPILPVTMSDVVDEKNNTANLNASLHSVHNHESASTFLFDEGANNNESFNTSTINEDANQKSGGKVINASKKVLSAAGRPFKSVKRRFAGGQRHVTRSISAPSSPRAVRDSSSRPSLVSDNAGSYRSVAQASTIRSLRSPNSSVPRLDGDSFAVQRDDNAMDFIVAKAENALRLGAFMSFAFIAGTKMPGYFNFVARIAEYCLVAWLTCVAIRLAAASSQWQQGVAEERIPLLFERPTQQVQQQPASTDNRTLVEDSNENEERRRGELAVSQRDVSLRSVSLDELSSGLPLVGEKKETARHQTAANHSALNPYYIIDTTKNARIFPNSTERLFPLDTDYFTGHMLALIRTPDVDDDRAVIGNAESDVAVAYFKNKQRRFEFQFQVKLKKIPTGRVYFCCELEKTIKMGMITRAFVSAALAFIKSRNNSFHYNLTGNSETADGKWESPHIAFPVEECMDRVVATRPGEQVPKLGGEIYEDEASIKERKTGQEIVWNMEDTYTFAVWSAYVDFLDWKCLNLPGIRPFSLTSVIGPQPIILTLYDLQGATEGNSKYHFRRDRVNIVRLEMCNSAQSGIGLATRKWIEQSQNTPAEAPADVSVSSGEAESVDGDFDEESEDEADDVPSARLLSNESFDLSEEAAEELGEGIYVRSGDTITLREFVVNEEDPLGNAVTPCYVTNGGGFAVLQEHTSSVIVIEKAGKSRIRKKSRSTSRLIKNGDTCIFKLVGKGRKNEEVETRYLSIHRGWWLKWVSSAPTNNGYFTVHTNMTELGDDTSRSAETDRSSYLTLGGPFWLKHRRWSKYRVGIASEASAKFGGRMLGLHIPSKHGGGSELGGNSDDSGDAVRLDTVDLNDNGPGGSWVRPLQLQAFESGATGNISGLQLSEVVPNNDKEAKEKDKIFFSRDQYNMDVPAWVEILNRTERIRQNAYIVRVLPPEHIATPKDDVPAGECPPPEESQLLAAFVRIRSGRDLAQVMRVGMKWRSSLATPKRTQGSPDFDGVAPPSPPRATFDSGSQVDDPFKQQSSGSPPVTNTNSNDNLNLSSYSFEESINQSLYSKEDSDSSDGNEWELESDDGLDVAGLIDGGEDPSVRQRKGRKLIGKIGKAVKTGTTKTGKSLAKHSVKVGKGTVKSTMYAGKATVNAGKAILPIRPKKPPMKEPKSTTRQSRRRRDRDLRVDVNSRSIRRIELMEAQRSSLRGSTPVLAGELSAPEQSCRAVSSMLSKMSTEPESSQVSASFSNLLCSVVDKTSEYDNSFLQGGSVQIGVTPKKVDGEKGKLLLGKLVARCLWESHWREEWCGLYEKGLVFYAPLTSRPCCEMLLIDIKTVRFLGGQAASPLANYPVLVIETAWLCHYCAFSNDESRQSFYREIEALRSLSPEEEGAQAALQERELVIARFWQGFQTSIEFSRSVGIGKWSTIASGSKRKSRVILNNRRMVFDQYKPETDDANDLVQSLLSTALSFSLDSLQQNPEALVKFLDSTSFLQTLSLDFDRSSPEAFCLFVNIYHCLLQHALLFSVNGPLHKRSFTHFMRTSCYEIGGDVFSLAELYSCVIRGNMSRPTNAKPPYVEAPKKSSSYRVYYALELNNPKTNFLLNTADASCPREIPVLTVQFEEQIDAQTRAFIRKGVVVDISKKQVILPKIFEVYRNDYATGSATGSSMESLRYCLRYLDGPTAVQIRTLLQDENTLIVKYHPSAEQFHFSLRLKKPEDSSAFQVNL